MSTRSARSVLSVGAGQPALFCIVSGAPGIRAAIATAAVILFVLLVQAPCEAGPRRGSDRIALPVQAAAGAGATADADVEPLPRFDVTGLAGWRGVSLKMEDDARFLYSYRIWDHRFLLAGTFGYYWTTHIKTEAEIGRTTDSRFWSGSGIDVPGISYPVFVRADHRIVDTLVTGRVVYQFGENDWIHPFVGAGVSLEHTRDRRDIPRQTTFIPQPAGTPSQQVVIAEAQTSTVTSRDAAGELIAGVKLYTNEHAFVRTDLIWALRADGDHRVSWRIGAGWDF
jgi:hypothetical protein